jgi:hypothetical protein
MASVTLGDGRTLTVGDEFLKLSPADQQTWVNEVAATLPPPKPKERTLGERAVGLYKAADEGAIRGVAGLVGLPGTISDLGDAALRKMGIDVPDKQKVLPRPEDVERNVRQGPLYNGAAPYEPQGAFEDYALAGGEMLPGALLTGPMGTGLTAANTGRAALTSLATKVAPRVVAETALPAFGSETAGRAVQGTGLEPYARFAGGVAGGAVSGAMTRPGTATGAVREGLGGVTREQVDAARQLIEEAASGPNPVRLTWPEALSQVAQRPVMSNTMRHLEASPGESGEFLGRFYGARPDEVQGRVNEVAETLSPGQRARPSGVGPAATTAATDALEAARGDINMATHPLYHAGENAAVTQAELTYFRRAIPGFDEAAQTVRNDPQLARYVEHLPDNSVGFLDAVKQQLQQQARRQREGVEPGTGNARIAAGLERDAGLLQGVVEQASRRGGGETAQAMATQAARREAEVTPLTQGPLGDVSRAQGGRTENAITALFPKDPNTGSAAEIGEAVTRMRQQNPRAAADLIRQHVENSFNQAQSDLQGGRNQASGAKLRKDIFGTPQQRDNLRAAVTNALPDGDVRWQGLERLMDIMEATGTRQGIGSKTAYNANLDQILGQAGAKVNAVKALSGFPSKTLSFIGDKYGQYKLGQGKAELARILTDPGSAGMLRSLAGVSPHALATQKGISLASKLLNYGQAAHSHSEQRQQKRLYVSPAN